MVTMTSALPLSSFRRTAAGGGLQQLFRCDTEPLNCFGNPRPFLREKLLAFALQQPIAGAGSHEHAKASLHLDQLLVDQFLITLQNRERIDPILGRDIAHRRQRIAFFEHAVENHGNDTTPQLSVNWLPVVPFTLHPVFHHPFSYSDIVNYNTMAQASSFLKFFLPPRR